MPPKHGPARRPRIVWHDTALKQITAMTTDERARLDVLLTDITHDPAVAEPDESGLLRDYRRDGCRVLYLATALQSVIVVAYVEA